MKSLNSENVKVDLQDSLWDEWDSGWEVKSEQTSPADIHPEDVSAETEDSSSLQPLVSSPLERRLQELLREAQQSDQRITALEDLLLAAESAQRAQEDERLFLESWLDGIEQKFGLKEQEHAGEAEALQRTIQTQKEELQLLRQGLVDSIPSSEPSAQLQQTLEQLEAANQDLSRQLVSAQQRCRELEQQLSSQSTDHSDSLRCELAELAQERADLARQRHELVNELNSVASLPKHDHSADAEMACRIRTLREHLREIHFKEQQERSESTLASRIANLWQRVSK